MGGGGVIKRGNQREIWRRRTEVDRAKDNKKGIGTKERVERQ